MSEEKTALAVARWSIEFEILLIGRLLAEKFSGFFHTT